MLKITKEESNICVSDEKGLIESYNLETEVNFKDLVSYLLNKNLSEEIQFEDKVEEKNEAEDNLMKIIIFIINDFNKKVREYKKFVVERTSL